MFTELVKARLTVLVLLTAAVGFYLGSPPGLNLALMLHALGLALLTGRCVHALGVSRADEDYRLRVAGMALTFSAIVGAALLCLSSVLGRAV